MPTAKFWEYQFDGNADFVETFLCSASFGFFLLKYLELKPNPRVLDIVSDEIFSRNLKKISPTVPTKMLD